MLEITIIGFSGDTRALKTFQFENDALQAFLTECAANETGCQMTSLRALGVPLTVTGDEPKAKAKKAEVIADAGKNQPAARTAGPGSVRSETPAKPTTERK